MSRRWSLWEVDEIGKGKRCEAAPRGVHKNEWVGR